MIQLALLEMLDRPLISLGGRVNSREGLSIWMEGAAAVRATARSEVSRAESWEAFRVATNVPEASVCWAVLAIGAMLRGLPWVILAGGGPASLPASALPLVGPFPGRVVGEVTD